MYNVTVTHNCVECLLYDVQMAANYRKSAARLILSCKQSDRFACNGEIGLDPALGRYCLLRSYCIPGPIVFLIGNLQAATESSSKSYANRGGGTPYSLWEKGIQIAKNSGFE